MAGDLEKKATERAFKGNIKKPTPERESGSSGGPLPEKPPFRRDKKLKITVKY